MMSLPLVRIGTLALALALGACASPPGYEPVHEVTPAAAGRAAKLAYTMVGKPYRYGGSSPATGFDCSGLVYYSYRGAGVKLPRSTESLLAASRSVARAQLRRGDLLFFDQEGRKNSHVGIYLGKGRFVHAPSSGKQVRTDRLDSPYWKRHLSGVRRF